MNLVLFFSLLIPITISPGPVNIALAGFGARNGVLKTLPFFLGLIASAAVVIFLCAIGIHEFISEYEILIETIRYIGIAYIFYLAAGFFRHKKNNVKEQESAGKFYEGFLLTLLNPKFYTMVVVVFGQFANNKIDIVVISLLFLMVLSASQMVWLAFGVSIKKVMRNTAYDNMVNIFFGVILLLTGLLLLF